jgi:accessory gene regulator B
VENMSYLAFSRRWAAYLGRKTGLPEEKEIILTYGIEVLALNAANIALTLLLGVVLGVFQGTLAGLVTVALFRHSAGGAHSQSPWRCAAITVVAFPGMALLASYIVRLGQPFIDILTMASFLIGLLAIIRLAPVDNAAAPIISMSRRKKLKYIAITTLLSLAVVVFLLREFASVNTGDIRVCISLGILWVGFMLGGWGHGLMSFIDSFKIKKRREV